MQSNPLELEIPDVAGVKMIIEPQGYARFREIVSRMPGIEIEEEERHTGKYNAINLKLT